MASAPQQLSNLGNDSIMDGARGPPAAIATVAELSPVPTATPFGAPMPQSPVMPTRPDASAAASLEPNTRATGRAVASLLTGLGLALIVAALVDIAVLWAIQKEPNAQADFAALTATLDNFSLIVIALAALGGAMLLRGAGIGSVRILGTMSLIAGIVAGAIGVLLLLDVIQIRGLMHGNARPLFLATGLKGLTLAAVYALALVIAGIRAMRRD